MIVNKFVPRKPDYKFLIGIDTDLHKSGVAAWNFDDQKWEIHRAIANENLVEELLKIFPPAQSTIYLEAGWLVHKKNFRGGNFRTAQRKASDVGQNAGTGKMLVKMLQKVGYRVFIFEPLGKGRGTLKGIDGRWTVLGKKHIIDISGITSSINDDTRDAIYIVNHFRG